MTIALRCLVIFQLFIVIQMRENVQEVDVTARVQYDINSHKVMLYSKTYCPYSKRIKLLLAKYDLADMKVLELDKQKEMTEMQRALKKISKRSTVPQLFVNGEFVGGYDETQALEDKGNLKPILEKAHALRR